MRRHIVGFQVDDVGDWAAQLDCLHRQHIRHRPPFRLAPWITDPDERGALRFVAQTEPVTDVVVDGIQPIPPDVEHHVSPLGHVRFAIEFLDAGADADRAPSA